MTTYKITFITLDSNINSVFIDARSQQRAILIFESQYDYDEIINCDEVEN